MAKIVPHTCTYTLVRIKRSVTGPRRGPVPTPKGVGIRAGKPKADRAIRKEKAAAYQPLRGWYEHPVGVLICA